MFRHASRRKAALSFLVIPRELYTLSPTRFLTTRYGDRSDAYINHRAKNDGGCNLQTNSAEISLSKTRLTSSPKMSTHTPMKTIVYVDGLNLYYGSLRGTAFKWLDLYALFSDYVLGIDAELDHVRYYTAPMKASSSDDPASPLRQQRYLRALKAYRGDRIQIIQGLISRTTPVLRLARPRTKVANGGKVRVFQFTEKTDGCQFGGGPYFRLLSWSLPTGRALQQRQRFCWSSCSSQTRSFKRNCRTRCPGTRGTSRR
jgi:hypothetical protein